MTLLSYGLRAWPNFSSSIGQTLALALESDLIIYPDSQRLWQRDPAGATIPPDTQDPYLLKVRSAGGWGRYERACRARLAKTLARVVFPRLPTDTVSHVVHFAFHTGYY